MKKEKDVKRKVKKCYEWIWQVESQVTIQWIIEKGEKE